MDFSPMMVGALLLLATAIGGAVMWWVGGVAAHQKNMAYSAILKQQPSSEVWLLRPLSHEEDIVLMRRNRRAGMLWPVGCSGMKSA